MSYDTKKYHVYDFNGEMVSISQVTSIEKLQQLLCRELDYAETFYDKALGAIHALQDAHNEWLTQPGRGSK